MCSGTNFNSQQDMGISIFGSTSAQHVLEENSIKLSEEMLEVKCEGKSIRNKKQKQKCYNIPWNKARKKKLSSVIYVNMHYNLNSSFSCMAIAISHKSSMKTRQTTN